MIAKCSRRVTPGRLILKLWFSAFTMARVGLATPTDDTPAVHDSEGLVPAERRLGDWAAKRRIPFSATVATLPDGRHIAERDGGVLRNPASASKLVTAYTALKTLGPSYRHRTSLHGRFSAGRIQRLVIRGEGDPSFSSGDLQDVATRLLAMGLTAIDEPIVVDQSYFDDSFVPPAFEQQPGEWSAFRAPVCATAVDKNRLVLWVMPAPACSSARLYVEPPGAAEISGQVRCVDADTKARRIRLEILPPKTELPVVRVEGEVGHAEAAAVFERRVEDPRKRVGHVLREMLHIRGVKVASEVSLGAVDGLPLLYSHDSVNLSQLLYRLGKDSDNFAAEMLLKTIGARATGVGSSEAGAKVVAETIAKLGPSVEPPRWVNGSGLFDANRASTNLLVRVLVAARADPTIAPEYLAQLAIAGSDGTLSKRLRQLPKGCSVRAKTGTLRNTISLAGYLARADGKELAFALIFEAVQDQSATRSEIDRFVQSLCKIPIAGIAAN